MSISREKGSSIIGFPDEYVVLDLETTGFDPSWDEIIEIGAIRYKYGQFIDSFGTLVKPSSATIVDFPEGESPLLYSFENGVYVEYVSPFITALTGITNSMLKDAPSQEKAINDLIDYLGDAVIVGHNVNFDINFVYDTYMNYSGNKFTNDYIDTMRIARKVLRQLDHHRLGDICNHYDIDYTSAHRAIEDCKLTNACYLKLKEDALAQYSSIDDFVKLFGKGNQGGGRKLSVKDIKPEEGFKDEESLIFGKEVVITGTLEKMLRKDALQMVANIGGIPSNSVNKHTSFLVIANKEYTQMSDKKKKARDLILKGCDLQILSEDVFYNIIGFGNDENEEKLVIDDAPDDKNNTSEVHNPEIQKAEDLVKSMLGEEYKNTFSVSNLTQKKEIIGYSFLILNRVVLRIRTTLKDIYRIEIYNYQDSSHDLKDLIKTTSEVKESEGRLITVDLFKNEKELIGFISENEQAIREKLFDIYINFSPIQSFGCCHRYVECSDEKKCILAEKDPILARGCAYRKNVENNRIFYGQNKNC